MPAGRPTTYKPEYCDVALEYIGEQGKSITQFASFIKVHRDTVYQWAKTIPEFSDALKMAVQDSESIWEDRYVNYIGDKNCNPVLLNTYMIRRFWKDGNEEEKPEPMKIEIIVKNSD